MSAADKVTVIMLLSHVIGTIPDAILPARVHTPLATAIAHAQLMVLAVRGKRSYTKTELEQIFDRGFIVFFGALETVNVEVYEAAVREYNRKVAQGKKPDKKPKRFKKMTRLVPLPTALSPTRTTSHTHSHHTHTHTHTHTPTRSLPFCL